MEDSYSQSVVSCYRGKTSPLTVHFLYIAKRECIHHKQEFDVYYWVCIRAKNVSGLLYPPDSYSVCLCLAICLSTLYDQPINNASLLYIN